MALEIRLLDAQECSRADLAIAALCVEVLHGLYEERWACVDEQRTVATADLADILAACIRDGERAVIAHPDYLRLLDYPGLRCRAHELWNHLIDTVYRIIPFPWCVPLNLYCEEGPLARRVLRAVGTNLSPAHLEAVYRTLCSCLAGDRSFLGLE